MAQQVVKVAHPDGGRPKLLKLDESGALPFVQLQRSFPGATKLYYNTSLAGDECHVDVDPVFHPPSTEGWGTITYYCDPVKLIGSH